MRFPTNYLAWDFGPWLVKNTSNYYLAMDAYLEAENTKHSDLADLERDWRALAHDMAEKMTTYLALACGGEMRHAKHFGGGSRYDIWNIIVFALNGQPDSYAADVLDIWGKRFVGRGTFKGGYGGKPWGQACAMTAEWLRGDCSDVMFVELALNLHHNNSCIFNKLALDALTYDAILNAGGADSEAKRLQRWPIILKSASLEWRTRWEAILGHLGIGEKTEPSITPLAGTSAPKAAVVAGNEKLW